jgi:hypothetical protein
MAGRSPGDVFTQAGHTSFVDAFADLASCGSLGAEHAERAVISASALRALLLRIVELSAPEQGTPKVLLVMARLVGRIWVGGDLVVELAGNEAETTLSIFAEHALGIYERIVPAVTFHAPFDEFERAVQLAPRLIAPLHVSRTAGKLVLTATGRPPSSMKPLAIDESSIQPQQRETTPPPSAGAATETRTTAPPQTQSIPDAALRTGQQPRFIVPKREDEGS